MFNMSFLEIFAQDPKAKINKKTHIPLTLYVYQNSYLKKQKQRQNEKQNKQNITQNQQALRGKKNQMLKDNSKSAIIS